MTLNKNFNPDAWMLTLPVDSSGLTTGAAGMVKSISSYSSQYFLQTSEKLVFSATVSGATTVGTKYARSELRELSGGNLAAWTLKQGGTMTATLQVDEVPKLLDGSPGRVVIGQIHGTSEELVRLYWDKGTVYFINDHAGPHNAAQRFRLVDADGKSPDISLGENFSYVISAKDDRLVVAVYADGKAYTSETVVNSFWNKDLFYFKAGVYLGVNEKQGTGQGVVSFDALDFSHVRGSGFDGLTGNAANTLVDVTDYTGWNIFDNAAPQRLTFAGGSGNDKLNGTFAADRIDGKAGADVMAGGGGDDFYIVDNAGDVVRELSGGGIDKVFASVSYTLSTDVENLKLSGLGNISGTGNGIGNTIHGNDGRNVLSGLAGNDRLFGLAGADTLDGGTGNDRLSGGLGNDVLTGGSGTDRFVFDSALNATTNVDRITDFSKLQGDKIMLEADIFTSMGDAGPLASQYFAVGTAARTPDQHVIYDPLSGNLFYDADGSGAADAVLFAQLQKNLALSASDFLTF